MNEDRKTKRPSDPASLNSIQSDSPEKRPKLQPSLLRKTKNGFMERMAETAGCSKSIAPDMAADASGYSRPGTSGYSAPGTSGYSTPGTSGYSAPGTSGYSAPGTSGYSAPGTSGYSAPGTSGYTFAGTSGYTPAEHSGSANAGPSESRSSMVLTDSESSETQRTSETEFMSREEATVPFIPSPPQLWKDTSLVQDADTIHRIIPMVATELVYQTLAQHRAHPDRLNIATAAVLDSGPDPVEGSHQTETGGGHEVSDVSEDSGHNVSTGSLGESALPMPGTSKDDSGYYEDVKKVVVKVKAEKPDVEVNPTEVYMLLVQHARMKGFLPSMHRVDYAASFLLKNKNDKRPLEATRTDDIFNQAMRLNTEFPHVEASKIYELLEATAEEEDRLKIVRDKLGTIPSTSTSTPQHLIPTQLNESASNDSLDMDDPIYCDMKTIAKMFPDKDRNEIYAMVEVHRDRPDRIQVTIEELLLDKAKPETSLDISMTSNTSEPYAVSDPEPGTSTMLSPPPPHYSVTAAAAAASNFGDLQEDVQHLTAIFPDCDPNYIYERLFQSTGNADRVNAIATDMFEHKKYPRLKDLLNKQSKTAQTWRLRNRAFRIEEFLAKFPNPAASFGNIEANMRPNYIAHLQAQLKHDFPEFKDAYIQEVVANNNAHLIQTVRELNAMKVEIGEKGKSKKKRLRRKVVALKYPEDPDELFFCELWYMENEQRVADYFQQKKEARTAKVEEARQQKALYECTCCFDEELLFEEMTACSDGHLFCQQCIVRSVETAFGEGKTTFPCLTGFCEHQIPLAVLKQLLPSTFLSKVLRKLQEEEVRQAGLPNLVECPFCSFATIMDDPDDKVFRCLNPDCLKDSCRLCKELNHVPFKCEEIEQKKETSMRTFIEMRLNEAMIRKCHRCGKHFVKDVGCNKMTCICGATSCYVCRAPDINYNHFNGKACNNSNMNKLHEDEMKKAAKEAKAEYLRLHPECADIDLKYDPEKAIKDMNKGKKKNVFGYRDYEDEDSDEDNYDDVDDFFDEEDDYEGEEEALEEEEEDDEGEEEAHEEEEDSDFEEEEGSSLDEEGLEEASSSSSSEEEEEEEHNQTFTSLETSSEDVSSMS